MKIIGIIERNENGFYQISSDDEICEHGLGGYGYTAGEAKNDFMKSLEEAKDMTVEETGALPQEFSDIEVEFRYDLPSFFSYFDWINITAFAKKAGINESKMRAYKTGVASASEKTVRRIMHTIRTMGAELSAVTL